MSKFGAFSEVGKLRKVIVHRPGLALSRLTPTNREELLFDDVIWVKQARVEHNAFTDELSRLIPLSYGIAPFVAKRNTPLDRRPFAGIEVVEDRLKRLREGVRGRAEIRPTSARWAWVEYRLAQGGPAEGLAVLEAHRRGGRFTHYRKSLASC